MSDEEFDLAVRVGLPKYYIFKDGKITGRRKRKTFLNSMDMHIQRLEIKYKEFMGFCNECQSVTRHNNEGDCMTCEADFYANHHDSEK